MSVAEALKAPRASELPSRHKAGIVMLLRPAEDSWSAKNWRGFFSERARIA
jgi:hypothetical protein